MAVDEVKKIYDMGVFVVTSIAATWAYVWFYLVLAVISPGVVELWEAVLTVVFFLILVVLAYGADRYKAKKVSKAD
jgi:solute carrier family 8 (sodium/calcium exchanger)